MASLPTRGFFLGPFVFEDAARLLDWPDIFRLVRFNLTE